MSGKSDTFKTEAHIRDRFQEPMLRMLRRGGVTAIAVYPEGRNQEQFEKGDLEYEVDGRTVTVDLKGDREVYPGCTLFYETWSNYPQRGGWGRKEGISRIWYAFYPLGMVVVLDLPAWREEAEAWLEQDGRRERTQRRNEQRNLTKGVPCRPRDLLSWDRGRTKEGLQPIIVGICRLDGDEMRPMRAAEGVALLLDRAGKRKLWRSWPE